jgi:sulfur relay (sulfurtransferase) complex TusBCD TusD component (DsrE family)
MKNWRTEIRLQTRESTIKTKEIKINRGIFQGNLLSALWFCIALNLLSNTLNQSKYGYQIDKQHNNKVTLNHLLYMDDIKLFASNNQQLSSLLQITEMFSADIKMNFGIDKCKTCSIKKGKLTKHEGFQLASEQIIQGMNINECYKYLGFIQTPIIDH